MFFYVAGERGKISSDLKETSASWSLSLYWSIPTFHPPFASSELSNFDAFYFTNLQGLLMKLQSANNDDDDRWGGQPNGVGSAGRRGGCWCDDWCNSGKWQCGHAIKGKGEVQEDLSKIRIWVKLG